MTLQNKLLRLVNANSGEWIEIIPAVLGNLDGVVVTDTSGVNWARTVNGVEFTVYNRVAPEVADTKVKVGRSRSAPNIWQVIEVRETYAAPSSGYIKFHAAQHVYNAPDTVFADRKQVVVFTLLVSDGDNFKVQAYGGIAHTATGIKLIPNEELDLLPYVVTVGAKYVAVEVSDAGAWSLNEGAAFASPDTGTVDDIPVPAPGKYHMGFVLLFDGQTELLDSHIRVAFPLGIVPTTSDYQIHNAPEITTLNDDDEVGVWNSITELLAKITWANIVAQLTGVFDTLYAALVHSHDAATLTGQYRQFVYEVSGGDFSFVIDEDGSPVMALEDLE